MNVTRRVHPAMDRRRVIGSEVGNNPHQHREILGGCGPIPCCRRHVHACELDHIRGIVGSIQRQGRVMSHMGQFPTNQNVGGDGSFLHIQTSRPMLNNHRGFCRAHLGYARHQTDQDRLAKPAQRSSGTCFKCGQAFAAGVSATAARVVGRMPPCLGG
jgi:hypothetical protein